MNHQEFATPVQTFDDELVKMHPKDTRKPKLTLRHLNKLRKMREQKKLENMKHDEILQSIYGQPAPEPTI